MAVTPKIVAAVILGVPVLLVASACGAYEGPVHDSIKPGHGKVDYWKWRWLNYWWANTEDGNGLYAVLSDCVTTYRSTFPKWTPNWIIVWFWSAWRNSGNNVKRAFRDDTWLPAGAPSVWPL